MSYISPPARWKSCVKSVYAKKIAIAIPVDLFCLEEKDFNTSLPFSETTVVSKTNIKNEDRYSFGAAPIAIKYVYIGLSKKAKI
ncbi:hypothetical protein D3C75_662920 [compost metagenome]